MNSLIVDQSGRRMQQQMEILFSIKTTAVLNVIHQNLGTDCNEQLPQNQKESRLFSIRTVKEFRVSHGSPPVSNSLTQTSYKAPN